MSRHATVVRIGRHSAYLAVVACLLFAGIATAAENPFAARYLAQLKEAGIPATAEGLLGVLEAHRPGPEQQAKYARLFAQLGSDEFAEREAATTELLGMRTPPASLLSAALTSADPEIRWRSKIVLDATSKPRNDILYAALVVIQDVKPPGLAGPLLDTVPLCDSDYMRTALERALLATVADGDATVLRSHLKSEHIHARRSAALALGRILGKEAQPELEPLLNDPNDDVRLSAAEILVRHNSPDAYRALGKLLDSDQVSIRNRSFQLLQPALKKTLPFSAYGTVDKRRVQAEAWRKAVEEHLQQLPAKEP